MNIRTLRMKNSKKAVTPVIATIILIAATIVLALVVGAYTFGLFGSNVKTVTLVSATLYGGVTAVANSSSPATSSISLSLNNPGSASTISSFTLTGTALTSPITVWSTAALYVNGGGNPSSTQVNFAAAYVANGANAMAPGAVSSYTFYPTTKTTATSITTGQTFNYVINFGNGQSVSGSLIAQ